MIPASITTAINFLQKQVAQYSPLANASPPAVVAMQLNAAALVISVQSTLTATPSLLDTYVAATDQPSIVSGVLAVVTTADDAANLSLLRGVVGRVAANLDQLV